MGDGEHDDDERQEPPRSDGRAPMRLERIGSGGMGVVHRAWDAVLGRPLAMKTLRRQSSLTDAERAELTARFEAEAQITGQLEHPGIVPVHAYAIDDEGAPYFTMSLVRGRTLEAVIAELRAGTGGWTREGVVGLVLKAADALAYAHSRGVIHRDVKPANIMVGKFGEVYVMDWGLAKHVDDGSSEDAVTVVHTARDDDDSSATAAGRVLGTPQYMSPEYARGEIDEPTPAVDVYGLGAVLYALLAGHEPFVEPGETPGALRVLERVRNERPRPLGNDVPVELVAIVERAMAPRAADRFDDVEAFAAQLRAYLEGRVVAVYRTGAVVELRKWIGRNRLAAALLGVILVGAGTFTVAQLRSNADLRDANADLESEIRANRLLTDVLLARALLEEAGGHGPDHAGIAALARWIARSRDLVERRSGPAAFDDDADGVTDAERDACRADVARLVERLPLAEERLASWRDLERRSIDEHLDAWTTAREDIAALDVYGGLDLRPQVGLVPLARNESSGLWEFWHVLSGERPRRGDDGRWVVGDETGVVLVLVPGGAATLGATPDDPDAQANENPRDVVLDAFFVAAHEVTQAQYVRALGDNPSFLQPGEWFGTSSVIVSSVHPVETVTFEEAARLALQLGLDLPTEEQWEVAARAGTRHVYHAGDDPAVLEGLENVADDALIEAESAYADIVGPAPWSDGHAGHAPVGSFAPNAFGLYDTAGNVAEWTRSVYVVDPSRDEAPSDASAERVARGGFYIYGPQLARLAMRQNIAPTNQVKTVGVRLARAVER